MGWRWAQAYVQLQALSNSKRSTRLVEDVTLVWMEAFPVCAGMMRCDAKIYLVATRTLRCARDIERKKYSAKGALPVHMRG